MNKQMPTLQNLPLEMLDMVLMKTVLLSLSELMQFELSCKCLLLRIVTPLRRVWSEWNHRLTTRWFKIVIKRRLRNRIVDLQLLKEFQPPSSFLGYAVTQLGDIFCVLSSQPKLVCLYECSNSFALVSEILIEEVDSPHSIASCKKSKNLYITDKGKKCVWKISVDDHRLSLWLAGIDQPYSLSFSNNNQLLMLRDRQEDCLLEIYDLNAVLVRSLALPGDFQMPLHAVQKSDGNFVISHWKKMIDGNGHWVISQLTNNGILINQFYPKHKIHQLHHPQNLCLDQRKRRIFVSDFSNSRVILFDFRSLSWRQILLTKEDSGIWLPRICYDEENEQLIVGQFGGKVLIYAVA